MSALRQTALLTPEEYLAGEEIATERHEYLAGVVYGMAGGTNRHAQIGSNIHIALGSRLRGKQCRPLASDSKVRIQTLGGDYFYYPDVSVTCRPLPPDQTWYETPTVIFEVVSPSSENTDHREKRLNYQFIPTLSSYVIVEQDSRALTVWRRNEGTWRHELVEGPDAVLALPEIECSIPLAEIYEGVEV
jgi:Uma2 family endonuclease